ncbi:MAG: FAD-binding oxidoreductase [Oceanicola sp.]|nr:FAD-binding oxidoreductase [Oceanicola sp.]
MTSWDVTVRGAGAFGLACAWELTRRGQRVCVIDPGGPGAGASGGIVGALAPHVPENWNPKKAFQFAALSGADAFWQEVRSVSGIDPGYARTGRLQPLADARAVALAQTRQEQAQALWQGRFDWRVVEAARFGEWAPPSATGLVVFDTLSARISPKAACLALAAAIVARGGKVVQTPADAAGSQADATPVIWATGAAGLDDLSAHFGRTVGQGIKGQAALLQMDRASAPQLFVDGLHIIPHGDGTVAVGSTTEREFADAAATDALLDGVLDQARAAVPVLKTAPVIQRWAGLRPRARSRAPMLGAWPGRPGHYIANGGFKIGFGVVTEVARVMADLVMQGIDRIPEGFRVEENL